MIGFVPYTYYAKALSKDEQLPGYSPDQMREGIMAAQLIARDDRQDAGFRQAATLVAANLMVRFQMKAKFN